MEYSKMTYRQLADEGKRLRDELKKVDFAMREIESSIGTGNKRCMYGDYKEEIKPITSRSHV
jgi:hypothetical protein